MHVALLRGAAEILELSSLHVTVCEHVNWHSMQRTVSVSVGVSVGAADRQTDRQSDRRTKC